MSVQRYNFNDNFAAASLRKRELSKLLRSLSEHRSEGTQEWAGLVDDACREMESGLGVQS